MSTPEVPMDALRVLVDSRRGPVSEAEALKAIETYVRAMDAERGARRDEELAVAIVNATNRANGACQFKRLCDMPNPQAAIAAARAARAHIEGERAS